MSLEPPFEPERVGEGRLERRRVRARAGRAIVGVADLLVPLVIAGHHVCDIPVHELIG